MKIEKTLKVSLITLQTLITLGDVSLVAFTKLEITLAGEAIICTVNTMVIICQ